MPQFIRRHPALSLLILAMAIGLVLIAPVALGVLPIGFLQLGAASASVAGLILTAVDGGRRAVGELLRRGLIWRVGAGWWAFALLFPIVPTLVALYLGASVGGQPLDWSNLPPIHQGIPALAFLIVAAGVGEEYGWRGFGVVRVQQRHDPLMASLIIGACHSVWHLPLFLIEGEAYQNLAVQHGLPAAFLGFAVMVTASAVQFSWLFNRTRGSVLLVAVFHGATNAWNGYFDIFRVGMTGVVAYLAVLVTVSAVLAVDLRKRPRDLTAATG
ncbi:MAG: CPBP family intramembrane metalloprotease [Gemmatimonadales bacterium]|nr:CPBP family intramembrane metalloprotease [Gemmatimonadales bacterium]